MVMLAMTARKMARITRILVFDAGDAIDRAMALQPMKMPLSSKDCLVDGAERPARARFDADQIGVRDIN
jgi:hypothetical protein